MANDAIICINYCSVNRGGHMNIKIIILIIGCIMVVIGYWYGHIPDNWDKQPAPSIENGIKVGEILTPFNMNRLDGSAVTIGSSGKIIIINFWDIWYPCSEGQMLELDDFIKINQQKVDLYIINLPDQDGQTHKSSYGKEHMMTVLLDKDGEVYGKFQVNTIPTTIIINKHGMIKHRKSGVMTRNELEGIINSL